MLTFIAARISLKLFAAGRSVEVQIVQLLTSAKRLDDLASILEVCKKYHRPSIFVRVMCRFVVLRDLAIGSEMSMPLCNQLVIVCIDSKTLQSSD